MSEIDPDKLIAEFEAQQEKLDAELEKLGLGGINDFDETDQWKGYPDIVRVSYEASDDSLVDELEQLISSGADVNAQSPYGETALSQCFSRSAFAAMRLLLKSGADTSEFGWSEGHLAIVMGDVPDVEKRSPALTERNAGGRTLFLQACRLGNVRAAKFLDPITPLEGKYVNPNREGPVILSALSGSVEMIEWVLAQGYDIDEQDRFGGTALLDAVEHNHLPIAERLLEAGADTSKGRNISQQNGSREDRNDSVFGKAAELIMASTAKLLPDIMDIEDTICTPANSAHEPEMLRLLASHGIPLEEFDSEHIAIVTGADRIPETTITPEMFNQQSAPREGKSNAEHVDIPFWKEQIRTGRSGYSAEVECIGERKYDCPGTPVWSFARFGRTGTLLPDGRWVLIAGEHEDHYDPDFCIYADVTVIHPDARVDHYIYPKTVFPPTDFHTATLLGDHILLIGNLGYLEERHHGQTQVMRLNLTDFSIQRVETTGQNPGWISRHSAVLNDGGIIVSGGKIEPGFTDNTDVFELNLATMTWSRAT